MHSNDTRPPEETDDIGPIRLGEYVALAWRFKWLLILSAAASGALMFVISASGPRVYESTVTFAATPSKIGDTSPVTTASPSSFRPIIESRTSALAVIKELGLDKDPYRLTPTALFEEVASVDEVRGTNLMRVIVRFSDADLAARIANSLATHAVDVARRVSADEAIQARNMIGEQLALARTRLDDAEKQLKTDREEAQIEALKEDVGAALGKRGDLLDLLVTIESEKAKLKRMEEELAKHNRVDVMKKTIDSEPALAEAARAQAPGSSLGLQLRSEVVDQVYQDLDTEAATTRARLAGLQKQKAELVDVRKLNASQMPLLMRLYAREATIGRREVERDLARKIYEDISQRYEVARLQVAGRSAQLVIIDGAIPADRPVSREVARKTAVAALVGFCIALVALLVWDAVMQQRRRAPARS